MQSSPRPRAGSPATASAISRRRSNRDVPQSRASSPAYRPDSTDTRLECRHDQAPGSGGSEDREDHRRHCADRGPDEHARGQRRRGGRHERVNPGKGFAVVSNDIRTLSREASEQRRARQGHGARNPGSDLGDEGRSGSDACRPPRPKCRNSEGSLRRPAEDREGRGCTLALASRTIQDGADSILLSSTEIAAASRRIATAAEEASAASRNRRRASTELGGRRRGSGRRHRRDRGVGGRAQGRRETVNRFLDVQAGLAALRAAFRGGLGGHPRPGPGASTAGSAGAARNREPARSDPASRRSAGAAGACMPQRT